MKRATYRIYVFACLLALACGNPAEKTNPQVSQIIDGDTFKTTAGETIRILGVDTPEAGEECWATEATTFLSDLIDNQTVQLKKDFVEEDIYGRTLAYVYLDDVMINAEILRLGMWCILIIPPNNLYQDYFQVLENVAQSTGTGLWNTCGGCDIPL